MDVRDFMEQHFRHFNAAAALDAAKDYERFIGRGNRMLVTLAGAMSTAELGRSLAEMIRSGKVHAVCCTGANLEEDVFNLVAHDHYERVPHYRDLRPEDELDLLSRGMNRVTDTCIPEEEAMRRVERPLVERWKRAEREGTRRLPHRFLYEALLEGDFRELYQADPANSWVLAAAERDLPLFVPGWEDSTLGNMFAAQVIKARETGEGVCDPTTVRSGIEYMTELADWYRQTTDGCEIGFFQIGGGIAGDFPICVVPMISQDLKQEAKLWGYFCQISESTTSYGGYSGAVPNEKITWGKLAPDTPAHVVESDASIVAPLMFAYLLGW
jgi:deoxyhypusine synthase